jgi:hypothetical protein
MMTALTSVSIVFNAPPNSRARVVRSVSVLATGGGSGSTSARRK